MLQRRSEDLVFGKVMISLYPKQVQSFWRATSTIQNTELCAIYPLQMTYTEETAFTSSTIFLWQFPSARPSTGDGRILLFLTCFRCPSLTIDLLLMPEHHRGRVTGAKVVVAAWQASSSPNRKFGLHQPRGGNCHQQTWGLMGWIYALLSSSQCRLSWKKLKSPIWGLFSVSSLGSRKVADALSMLQKNVKWFFLQ